MDRNINEQSFALPSEESLSARRAWIEILCVHICITSAHTSLSARRAWIEIVYCDTDSVKYVVALRKESVDRNVINMNISTSYYLSLSARRAWIEILVKPASTL